MQTHVHLAADDTEALYHWLRSDASLRVHGSVTARSGTDSTRMNALELVDVVLTHLEGMSALALAVLAWRRTRADRGTVTFTRADGLTLTVPAGSTITAETIAGFVVGTDETRDRP